MAHDDVLEWHLADLRRGRRHADGTIYARERALSRMAGFLGMPLIEARTADLARWLDSLHVIDNTVVHYVSHARCFYRWCADQGLIARNPCDALPAPVLVRGLPRPMAEEELVAAVLAAPARIRPWLVLAGWAGLRCKEIALLRRERVLDNARPPVLLVASDATKGRNERVVPMSSIVRDELRAAGLPKAGYLFRRADGRPGPNSPAVISHVANRHLYECGIDATMHMARHFFATRAYWLNPDLRMIQELLGHADPATAALYTAYNARDAIGVVEAFPRLMPRAA